MADFEEHHHDYATVDLRERDLIALRALDEDGTGQPIENPSVGDPFKIQRAMVMGLVKRGHLPNSHFGPTLNRLYGMGLVDGYRMGYNSQDYGEMVWWITDAGREALNRAR